MWHAFAGIEFSQAYRVSRPFGGLVDLVEEGRLRFRHAATVSLTGSHGES